MNFLINKITVKLGQDSVVSLSYQVQNGPVSFSRTGDLGSSLYIQMKWNCFLRKWHHS